MAKIKVRVTRYGYATIDTDTKSDAINQAKNMPPEDFDWSDPTDEQVVHVDHDIYCYVRIEPLLNKYYDIRTIEEIRKISSFEDPFGIKPVFINENGDLQIKHSSLEIIDNDNYTNKKNRVLCLYKGELVVAGIIREWSKSPIRPKINKVKIYKNIQAKIDNLKDEQRNLIQKNLI